MMEKLNGETCIICEQQKQNGFHLYTSFICIDCEREMVQTDTDHPLYKFYLQQLSKVSQKQIFS
ncbi:sigma factor G inhibitor Gin [Caldifermentibacillus hisashii]|uniref:sigma factor G inhibitor Gin n=1 Tax=Caldifermentibacillus hisashii TaxID=996558 RepID=UPI002E09D1DA|nr:sigma factor G inhibitor Gin [Caldifermentibacillus hisashii]